MVRKKLMNILSFALCMSLFAAPVTGCSSKKDLRKDESDKQVRDKHRDDDDDDDDDNDDDIYDTVPTDTDVTYDASNIDLELSIFIDTSKIMLGLPGDKFNVLYNTGSSQTYYSDEEYNLICTVYEDEADAREVLDYSKDIFKQYTGPNVRMQIYDDFIVIDDVIDNLFDGRYVYGTEGVVGNVYYSLFYYGTDLDKMWNFGNYIGACSGLHSPYNDMSGNPDLERFANNGMGMEELLSEASRIMGFDRSKVSSFDDLDYDALSEYEYYDDNICINIELFNYSANARIYLYSYEDQAQKQFGDDLVTGEDYMFLKTTDPEYIYGGIWVSGCYLIDIECYSEEYVGKVDELIAAYGLTVPDT